MLKKNQIHKVVIEGYSSEGLGIARIEGQVVFVGGALSGESCEIKILKAGKSLSYAKLESVIRPSESRISPKCPYFGRCGGCDLHHMSYEEELRFKRRRVDEAFERIGGLSLRVEGIIGAENTGAYRNKVIFALAGEPGKVEYGFYRARSHQLVPIKRCLIQPEHCDRAAGTVVNWMNRYKLPAYDESTGRGLVRYIYMRTAFGTGQTVLCLVATKDRLPELPALVSALRDDIPLLKGVLISVNKSKGNTVLGDSFRTVWGEERIIDRLCGMDFSISPEAFYQINHAQTEKLYKKAAEYAQPGAEESLLDLYCGAGTIGLTMTGRLKRLIGAEIVEAAVEDARENALRNGITNAEFYAGDASDTAKMLAERGLKPDIIVVDPPRKGLSPQVIDAVLEMAPKRLVYVSCDPGTLAKDLKRFSQGGLQPLRAVALDMFPRTRHVETVVLMSRNG